MIKISVIGTGYVGLVSGACLSEFGFDVICMDVDQRKISLLEQGHIPIYEPGLKEIVQKSIKNKRLSFTTDYAVALKDCDVAFIAVGTPPQEDGSADLSSVLKVAATIGRYIDSYIVVVDKSTVPVGTGQRVKQTIRDVLRERDADIPFDVVSNPEFLREGTAVVDFMQPDRIVIGAESERAFDVMKQVYRVLYMNNSPFVFCDIETAEVIKYASNAYLATRITFVNELALLCEAAGADVTAVSKAMGQDKRIGPRYLHAGPGYGGSCFPKDTRALLKIAEDYGLKLTLVDAVVSANERQKLSMVEKIRREMGDVSGKSICVLGVAFKPDTDDVREAPAITIVRELDRLGTHVTVYDPISMDNAKQYAFADMDITYAGDEYGGIQGADALVIVTEWNEFRNLDLKRVRSMMKDNYLFDLRNIYARQDMEALGFRYYGVGR